jgi:Flp pilus assembly protein TadG
VAHRRSERGVAAVEMALLLPVLVLLFMGIVEFGRAFYTAITLAHAARAGAQYGAQSPAKSSDVTGIKNAATQEAQNIVPISFMPDPRQFCKCPDSNTLINCNTGTCTNYGLPQMFVEVTTNKTYETLFSYPGIPSSIPMTRSAVLRVQ